MQHEDYDIHIAPATEDGRLVLVQFIIGSSGVRNDHGAKVGDQTLEIR